MLSLAPARIRQLDDIEFEGPFPNWQHAGAAFALSSEAQPVRHTLEHRVSVEHKLADRHNHFFDSDCRKLVEIVLDDSHDNYHNLHRHGQVREIPEQQLAIVQFQSHKWKDIMSAKRAIACDGLLVGRVD
ncbi:MAG TPA: hypothetical protein DD473_27675 [Planctomycetaceae bacterium]|nr:hypothetical protein [Planctomycetaceae bacterium]